VIFPFRHVNCTAVLKAVLCWARDQIAVQPGTQECSEAEIEEAFPTVQARIAELQAENARLRALIEHTLDTN
jgi:hypothetical protein